ncbi:MULTISPECIES: hypothetical protein [Gordonia]|uniref:hypothetical protein n=1 Tax=Gordonia TaxID=2053 RepID=UPI00339899D8
MTPRLDRTGEPIDDEGPTLPAHDPACDAGWIGGRDADHPRPCLQCRPHLRQLADVADCTPEPRPGDPR